ELACIGWASALMLHTYNFVEDFIKSHQSSPPFAIPQLRFVPTALVITQDDDRKAFLLEQMIPDSFGKYISNASPRPLKQKAKSNREIAEFLVFVQHHQYESTKAVYISDFQGGTSLLTDPQIITDPYFNLFNDGNVGFTEFPSLHDCNKFCSFFML
ncbi:hypothetical protein K435DRAFT_585995, partial [Dendrothele bispora CBS 962.96]